MQLTFIPKGHAAPIIDTITGEADAVRQQTAALLRTARNNGAKPRLVADGVLTRLYQLSNGLLKLCL